MTHLPLHTLETTGLIRLAQMEPELEYLFRHALVQDAAYDSILKADRKKLHLAVAREMEHLYPERLDELSALLANHYREAGDLQKALEYYKRAGLYAFQKRANLEAEYNLRAALEICADEMERADICRRLGFTILDLGRLEEAEKFLREALPAYRAHNERNKIAEIYNNLSQIAWGKNDVTNSLAIAREGLKEVGDLPPSGAYAELLRYIANGCIFNNLLDEAEACMPKLLATAEQSGSNYAFAQALVTQGLIEDRRGRSEQAMIMFERAASIAEKSKQSLPAQRARNNLAYMLIKLGRNIEAAEQLELMVAYSRQISSVFGELWFLAELNNLYGDLGKIDEVVALVPVMMDLLKASGGKTYRIQVEGARLQSLVYTGKPEEAIADLYSLREDTLKHNDGQMFMNYSYTLALGYTMMKDYSRAAQEMERGIQGAGIWAGANYHYRLAGLQARAGLDISIAQESLAQGDNIAKAAPNFVNAITRLYALMHIRAREEKFDEALSLSVELAEKYRAAQLRWYCALTLWDAGGIALKARNKTKAKELLQQALNEYQEMHIPIYAAQIGETLNNL